LALDAATGRVHARTTREKRECKRETRERDFITYRDRSARCSVGKDGADVSLANDRLSRAHPLARAPSQVKKKKSARYLGL
jgi:hypothetical protein